MSQVLRFTRLDLRVQLATLRATLAVAALLALMTLLLTPAPEMMVAVFTFAAAIVAVDPFRGDERGRLDVLYAVLPVARTHVVGGRYLTMLAIQIAFGAAGVLLALAAATAKSMPLDARLTVLILTAGFAINALILAVETPVVFRLGYAKTRWVAFTPMLVIVALVALANSTGLNLTQAVLSLHTTGWLPAVLLAAGIIVLTVSALISTRLYTTRDL